MIVWSRLKRLVKLCKELDRVIVFEGSMPVAQYKLTQELALLFGHHNVLYFEAIINNGMLTLGNNVAPPHDPTEEMAQANLDSRSRRHPGNNRSAQGCR
jgi:hypothetical protein